MCDILFLDDSQARCKKFLSNNPSAVIVHDAQSCIDKLSSQAWGLVCLDHDLGGEEYQDPNDQNTGSAVVRWIVANYPRIDEIIVHSLNIIERKNMVADLVAAGYNAREVPFFNLV